MKQIGTTFVEDNLILTLDTKERNTVRSIVLNQENKVLLLYSEVFDDYTFPGGGIHVDETPIMALERELLEELGANYIDILSDFGYTEEIKHSFKNDQNTYHQISYYYFCKIESYTIPEYVGREKYQKLSFDYVNLDEAIKKNEHAKLNDIHQKTGFKTVMDREITVLKKLKEYLHEKI